MDYEEKPVVKDGESNKRNGRRVLRAHDIVPSSKGMAGGGSEAGGASEIPQFDLAEQILAEQRRLTASRRKAPGGKGRDTVGGQQAETVIADEATGSPSEQEQLIADIVARDIERLCGGGGRGD